MLEQQIDKQAKAVGIADTMGDELNNPASMVLNPFKDALPPVGSQP